MSASETISLYDDWRVRRDRLPADSAEQTIAMQVQLLDYLLARHKNDPEAQQPARFPLPTTCVVNRRALVVHHHLSSVQPTGTKTASEVHDRISKIVGRMWSNPDQSLPISTESASSSPASGTPPAAAITIPLRTRLQFYARWLLEDLSRSLRLRSRQKQMGDRKLRKLFAKLANPDCCDVWLLQRLVATGHPKIVLLAINTWADRVRAGCDDVLTRRLCFFVHFARTDRELDRLRSLLDDDNPRLRLAAIDTLANCGTLDDVSLLSDLLSLPWQPQEHHDERPHLASAIQAIARRATGAGDEAISND